MFRFNRKAIAVIGASYSALIATTAHAINAVFIPDTEPLGTITRSKIEVQGFNGRLDFPGIYQGIPFTLANEEETVVGATANDSIVYTLLSPAALSTSSIIIENDAHTGALLGTIQLPGIFTDIAYTNGQLYGAQSVPASNHTQTLQISSIASNGATQPVLTQSTSSFSSINWRLSGVVNGDSLLMAPSFPASTITAETFVPSTPATPPTTFSLPIGSVSDTVIHADGASVTNLSTQTDYTYPGGAKIGPRPPGSNYSGSISSDEFSYTYAPSQSAFATISAPFDTFLGTHDGLYRTPQIVTASEFISLENGVAPDNTTLSNFAANNVLHQTAGTPLPFTIQETDAAPGSFTLRSIATANISVNLATATHGIYGIGANSNLTADYTTGATTQTGRPVTSTPNGVTAFAYDPASANLVGNGDGSLSSFGWETFDTLDNVVANAFAFHSDIGLGLFPSDNDTVSLSQILSSPTSNGPMEFSFTYDDSAGLDPADLTVSLNGVLLTDLSVNSTAHNTFQTIINNPDLENLTNAKLTFTATPTGTLGVSFVGLGSITLEAVVPEPASASLLGLAAMTAFTRRRRPQQIIPKVFQTVRPALK